MDPSKIADQQQAKAVELLERAAPQAVEGELLEASVLGAS